ncbi:MAG TPA: ABC transporter ATP-binding protein [Chloroflexota bacterium]|nr:ABC transporter ATP-binding protein [Chloroflexota bacterium]
MTLQIERLNAFYGPSHVLHDVSLTVESGQSVAIIGRNGMGKTTLLHSIVRMGPRVQGKVLFDGVDLTVLPLYRIARLGLCLVPQERRVFKSLTVWENLRIARRPGGWSLEAVLELFPNLAERLHHYGDQLSGGERQMLSIARALVNAPRLLLLDEPTEGLAPLLVAQLREAFRELRRQGLSFVIVEQKFSVIQDLVDYVYVLEKGQIVAGDRPANLLAQPEVLSQYLGVR